MKHLLSILICIYLLVGCSSTTSKSPYYFDGNMPRHVLENYLSRAVTMSEFATPSRFANDGVYLDKERDIEIIKELGVKFVGRSIYRWGGVQHLNNPLFLSEAQALIGEVHEFDPEVIFQAAIFEAVYPAVNDVVIPAWAFEAMDMPVEVRNFELDRMLPANGTYVGRWGGVGSVPDITNAETQLWFMYLIGSYINIGVESIHLGQIHLIGMNDTDWTYYDKFLQTVRSYAAKHARRHLVLFDAHTHGMINNDGVSLLDFNSYPLRIKPVVGEPLKGVLEVGYQNSIYGKSMSCVTPSGWKCESLPYLVEFDNDGISDVVGVADINSHRPWGYDEFSWFYMQGLEGRHEWLKYAYHWTRNTDKQAFMQISTARVLTLKKGQPTVVARAGRADSVIPFGMDIVETIKEIWAKYPPQDSAK